MIKQEEVTTLTKKIKIKLELELAITEGFGEVNSVFIVITLAKILMRRLSPGKM